MPAAGGIGGVVATFFGFTGTAAVIVAAMSAAVDSDPDISRLTVPRISTVRIDGETVRIEKYSDIAPGTRLCGPLVSFGHCMDAMGFTPGTIVFADPALEVRGSNLVLVTNHIRGKGPMGTEQSASIKILEYVGGTWWLRDMTGAGIAMHSSIQIIGRIVASIHLPESSITVRDAQAETERVYATLPPDRKLPDAIASELENRREPDRRPYPMRAIIGPLFWRTIGLPHGVLNMDEPPNEKPATVSSSAARCDSPQGFSAHAAPTAR